MAPIKKPLSRKNTSPSQKTVFFLQGQHPVTGSVPIRCLRPWFQKFWWGSFDDLLPGTHQIQGRGKKKIR